MPGNFTQGGVELVAKNFGGFMSDLGKANKRMGDLGGHSTSVAGHLSNLGSSVVSLGATLAKVAVTGVAALGAAIAGIGTASLKAAIDFESAFAGVLKTTDGLTDEFGNLNQTGKELQQGFRDLATETPIAVEELLKIGELGGQLGVAKEDLIDFTETIAAMGVSTNLSTEEAASALARMANIMGTVEEEGSKAFELLGSTIVDLGNNFATTESEILNFGLRIAGAGEIAGLTEADVLAIGAAMSSVGVQAEAGGTAVQKVLISMNEAVAGATTGFVDNTKAIGKNQEKLVGIQADMVRYEAKTGMTEQAMRKLHDEFIAGGGTMEQWGRQLGDTNREHLWNTIQSLDNTRAALEQLQASQGKPIKVGNLQLFAQVSGRTAAQFKKDWEEDSGKVFQDFIKGLGDAGDDAIKILDNLGLSDQRLVRSFLSLANAGDLVVDTMDTASEAWDENTALAVEAGKRYATTESQMVLLKNTIKDVGIGIGQALLPTFNDLLSRFREFISAHGPAVTQFFQQFAEWLAVNIPIAIQTVAQFWTNTLQPALEELWSIIQNNVIPVLKEIWDWLGEQLPKVIAFVTEHWEAFKNALIAMGVVLAGAAVLGVIINIAAAVAALANPITLIIAAVGLLAAAWTEDWGGIRTWLTKVWNDTLKPIFDTLVEWLKENIPKAIQVLRDFWIETLEPALKEVWDFIKNVLIPLFGILWEWLKEKLTAAIQRLTDYWNTVLKPALEAIWQFISGVLVPILRVLWDWIYNQLTEAFQNVKTFWEQTLKPALEAFWQFVQETLIPILVDLYNQIKSVVEDALEVLKTAFNKVKAAADDFWQFIKNKLLPKLIDFIVYVRDTAQGVIDGFKSTITAIKNAFERVRDAVQDVIDKIKALIKAILNVIIPSWLQGGSPPPAANWFAQIAQGAALAAGAIGAYNKALAAGRGLAVGSPAFVGGAGGGFGAGSQITNNVTIPITATIGGEVDMLTFERRVEAVLVKTLSRGM